MMVNALFRRDIPLSSVDRGIVLSAYIRDDPVSGIADRKRPAVLILPDADVPVIGDQRAERTAFEFTLRGFQAFVLHRGLKAAATQSIVFLEAGFSAIACIRNRAQEWNVNDGQIAVCGVSGGAQLAVGLMTLFKDPSINQTLGVSPRQLRPDAGILIHFSSPQPSAEAQPAQNSFAQRVDGETAPAFIWCQSGGRTLDENRAVGHLTALAAAMLQNGIPVELHIFGDNAHGFSLAREDASRHELQHPAGLWHEQAIRWLVDVLAIPAQEDTQLLLKRGGQEAAQSLRGIDGKPVSYYNNIFNDRERMFQHTPFSLEQDLVRSVINADERTALVTASEISRRDDRAVLAKDPLRSVKNSMICFITLLTRAVIQAGVSDEEAFALSDAAIQHIETLRDPEKVLDYKDPAVVQFVHLVKTRQDRNYSVTIRKAIHYITSNLEKPFQLAAVAAYCGVHPNYLSRRFKQETGATLSSFMIDRKIYEATYFVQHTDYTIAEIGALYGFSSQSHFSRAFKNVLFISPGNYRNRGK